MKRIIGIALVMFAGSLSAQPSQTGGTKLSGSGKAVNVPVINLKKGQVITAVTTMDQKTDMGMGGEMSTIGGSTNTITITDMDSKSYMLDVTLAKMKMNMDMMGNATSYNSEDKNQDPENEMTKTLGGKIGKAEKGTVDIVTGKVTMTTKEEEAGDENPLKALMGGSDKTSSANAAGAFFIIPAEKKAGDTWESSEGEDGMKNLTTYKILSIAKDIVNIEFQSIGGINKEVEMQGMQMTVAMSTKGTGTMAVNIATGVLVNRKEDTEIDGTLDVMGQSTPINVKLSTNASYTIN